MPLKFELLRERFRFAASRTLFESAVLHVSRQGGINLHHVSPAAATDILVLKGIENETR